MLTAAAVLIAGIHLEVDLIGLFRRAPQRKPLEVVCGIRVIGYHFTGRPGQQFGYDGETFTIPREGFVELISVPRLKDYSFADRTLPLDPQNGVVDGFGFRWIELPASAAAQRRNDQ